MLWQCNEVLHGKLSTRTSTSECHEAEHSDGWVNIDARLRGRLCDIPEVLVYKEMIETMLRRMPDGE